MPNMTSVNNDEAFYGVSCKRLQVYIKKYLITTISNPSQLQFRTKQQLHRVTKLVITLALAHTYLACVLNVTSL